MTHGRLTIAFALACCVLIAGSAGVILHVLGERPQGTDACVRIADREDRRACIGDHVAASADVRSPESLLTRLDSTIGTGPVSEDCHDGVHRAVRTLAKRHGAGALAFPHTENPGLCTQAYQHEVLGQLVRTEPARHAELKRELCLAGDTRKDVQTCYHGLGHAIVIGELPAAEADALCAGPKPDMTANCLQGMYMERVTRLAREAPDTAPEEVCAGVPAGHDAACFAVAAGFFPEAQRSDSMEERLAWCHDAPATQLGVLHCVGTTAAPVSIRELDQCAALGPAVERAWCAFVVAQTPAPENGTAAAREACRTASGPLGVGCALGYGRAIEYPRAADASQAASLAACTKAFDGDLAQACSAGVLDCWPAEAASYPQVDARCSRIDLPDYMETTRTSREVAAATPRGKESA